MIVKNESGRIERALASVAPFVSSWAIVDTGSTDDTRQRIIDFFGRRDIPGALTDAPFVHWSQARNAALAWARQLAATHRPDYFLLMDADMQLQVYDEAAFMAPRDGACYEMYQRGGSLVYANVRLVSGANAGVYRGVTHEYFDSPSAGPIPAAVADFIDHADGANRPDKFTRDIQLLTAGLQDEPDNARYMFYLGNSYRDAGRPAEAIDWYERRVAAGGWDEEVWQAQFCKALCLKACGREPEFLAAMLRAHSLRPQRAEALYELARHFRGKRDEQAMAVLFAEAGLALPMPDDKLFVNQFVYSAGLKDEIAVCGYYVPGKFMAGYQAASEQALHPDYPSSREAARTHLYFYVQRLDQLCPSFRWTAVDFAAPPGWVAMNPSVCLHEESLWLNIRCVNYRIDAEGRYLIRNTRTGEVNAEQPIATRNFLCRLGETAFTRCTDTAELIPPPDLPVAYPLVTGFEDVRLIPRGDGLWCSATVRQVAPDGLPEQVFSRLDVVGRQPSERRHTRIQRMLRTPRLCEKNWTPILTPESDRGQCFIYRPGEVVDTAGRTVVRHGTPGRATDHISGSSQAIRWHDDWLAVTHEARSIPGSHLRWYMHRFVLYDRHFRLKTLSLPFVFHDKVIEFCAGMCWSPDGDQLVLSYGYKDEEARMAVVDAREVGRLLWTSP